MKKDKLFVENLFKELIEKNLFIKATISNPIDKKNGMNKGNLKPVLIKGGTLHPIRIF